MEPQLVKELAAVLGPTGVVVAVLLMERFRGRKEPADPAHELAEELRRELREVQRELAAVREALAGMRATIEYLKEGRK
jgi:hypothetical protein